MKAKLMAMRDELDAAFVEMDKLENKGVKTSATRLRSRMQTIRVLAQEVRIRAMEIKKEL